MQLGRSFFEGVVVSISPLRKLLHNPWQHQRYYVASLIKDLHDLNQSLSNGQEEVAASPSPPQPQAVTLPSQVLYFGGSSKDPTELVGRSPCCKEHSEVLPPALIVQLLTITPPPSRSSWACAQGTRRRLTDPWRSPCLMACPTAWTSPRYVAAAQPTTLIAQGPHLRCVRPALMPQRWSSWCAWGWRSMSACKTVRRSCDWPSPASTCSSTPDPASSGRPPSSNSTGL
jgi:hypothetical protein